MTDLLSEVRYEHTPPVGVKWHEYANLFPWLEGQPLEDLKSDIKENGVLEPIVFLGEAILDGRNRYTAARELGLEYPRVDYLGEDPLGFVISKNLKRRHLTESQRGMVAANLAKMPSHRPAEDNSANLRTSDAARMLNVSSRTVETARKVMKEGAPELVKAVETGDVSVSAAADLTVLPVEDQIKALAQKDPAAMNRVVKQARAVKQRAKKEKRVERERDLGDKQKALPDKKYGVILADPEWDWESYSAETGMDRAAANHYPTSTTAVIADRNVPSIAADDCVLFLWATAPKIEDALLVMKEWGFAYKSMAVWVKDRVGTGYWFRNKHEILLVGTKGKIPAPAMGEQVDSVIEAPVGEHSAKPEAAIEMIEWYFPTLPKIELNRRGPARAGWDAWGLEAA